MTVEKIEQVLKHGKSFIGSIVAGDLDFEKSVDYVVEIGIAFSDPSVDGKTIMKADLRATKAGSTTKKVFEFVANIRKRKQVPLVF